MYIFKLHKNLLKQLFIPCIICKKYIRLFNITIENFYILSFNISIIAYKQLIFLPIFDILFPKFSKKIHIILNEVTRKI
jgi:hypothetical protein